MHLRRRVKLSEVASFYKRTNVVIVLVGAVRVVGVIKVVGAVWVV